VSTGRVGFIGLGNMGAPIAERTLAAGIPLTVSDINPTYTAPSSRPTRISQTAAPVANTADLAVVDPQLRVRGVSNLRVVDASVMPNCTVGNVNATAVAIHERAADLIRTTQPQS